MQKRSSRQEPDPNLIAKSIVDQTTGITGREELTPAQQAARMLGRLGGLKGGPARNKRLSAKRRTEIAKIAAVTRWSNKACK
jgi:hypothetical protein